MIHVGQTPVRLIRATQPAIIVCQFVLVSELVY